MGYLNEWKKALTKEEDIEVPEGYPHKNNKLKSFVNFAFVSFVLPFMLLPLAVKGVKMGIEALKKAKEDKKKK